MEREEDPQRTIARQRWIMALLGRQCFRLYRLLKLEQQARQRAERRATQYQRWHDHAVASARQLAYENDRLAVLIMLYQDALRRRGVSMPEDQ